MILRRAIAGLLGVSALLAISPEGAPAAAWELPYPRLSACTGRDTDLFRNIPYPEWKDAYHDTVEAILQSLYDAHTQQTPGASCSESSAPEGLERLARKLEPWREGNHAPFGAADTAPVLLEYLRIYECALAERTLTITLTIRDEEYGRRITLPGGWELNPLLLAELLEKAVKQRAEIAGELRTARPTLENALTLVAPLGSVGGLAKNVECLQRASLDIRNAFALAAEATSCLPRIWNAREALRDMPECGDGMDNDGDGSIDLQDDACDGPGSPSEG